MENNGGLENSSRFFLRREKVERTSFCRYNWWVYTILAKGRTTWEIINFNLNDEGDLKYKLIVFNELYFIRQNSTKIEKTASNLYKAKVNQSKEPAFKQPILNVTLDFLKLEDLCKNFKRK